MGRRAVRVDCHRCKHKHSPCTRADGCSSLARIVAWPTLMDTAKSSGEPWSSQAVCIRSNRGPHVSSQLGAGHWKSVTAEPRTYQHRGVRSHPKHKDEQGDVVQADRTSGSRQTRKNNSHFSNGILFEPHARASSARGSSHVLNVS